MNPNENNQNLNNNTNPVNQEQNTNTSPVSTLSSEDLIIQGGYTAPIPNVPVQPSVAPQGSAPVTPTPMPQTQQTVPAPTPMPTDPNANIAPVNMSVAPQANEASPEVINTTKAKSGSNIGVFIIVIILIAFVLNVDTVVSLYDKYMKQGSLVDNNNSSDNLSDGYIQIGEASSSKKEQDITFNNFAKSSSNTITLNYSSASTYNDVETLKIFFELYDSSKKLLYTEQFKVENMVEKDTIAQYSMVLDQDIYNKATYVLVKTISTQSNVSLLCTYSDEKYSYSNKYNFLNEGLISYDTSKKYIGTEEDNTLETEFNNVDKSLNPTYENKTLKQCVRALTKRNN